MYYLHDQKYELDYAYKNVQLNSETILSIYTVMAQF